MLGDIYITAHIMKALAMVNVGLKPHMYSYSNSFQFFPHQTSSGEISHWSQKEQHEREHFYVFHPLNTFISI